MEKIESVITDPKLTQSSDVRCGCCPYGYHIDLDFLRYLSSLTNGELSQADRKKMLLNKKKLRKSMELFLHQQELARKAPSLVDATAGQSPAAGGSTTQPAAAAGSSGLNGTTTDEKVLLRTEGENEDTEKLLEEFDKAINAQLRLMDHTVTSRDSCTKTDLQTATPLSHEDDLEHRFRTETEFKLSHLAKGHGHHVLMDYDDSCSSMSVSSGPSSPSCQFSPALERSKIGKAATAETKQPSSTSFVSSIQLANNMAALLVDRETTTTDDDVETIPLRSSSLMDLSEDTTTDMTQISSGTLQAIRKQMAVSLERMRELEEQVKAIPVLKVLCSDLFITYPLSKMCLCLC